MYKLKDKIVIIQNLTFKKFYNGILLVFSFYYSKFTKRVLHLGNPISLSFEPTTSCNLRCPECPSGLRSFTRPTGMLQTNIFNKTIDELHQNLLYLIFYFQGEPYLNPQFLDMVKYASSKKIFTATSTNAHYLNDDNCKKTIESGLHRLIISIFLKEVITKLNVYFLKTKQNDPANPLFANILLNPSSLFFNML